MKTSNLKALFIVLFLVGTLFSSYALNTRLTVELKGYKSDKLSICNFDYGKYKLIVDKKFDLTQTNGVASIEVDLDKPILVMINNYFDVFLAPGDNLHVKADVTSLLGGLKISYLGKGKENNEYLYNMMNIYYKYFPVPLNMLYDQKLNTKEIARKYEATISSMNQTLEKNKSKMNISLYKYLYTYIHLRLPAMLYYSIRNNTYDQDVDLLKKYKIDLNQVKLYSEGYYDMNFLNSISRGFKDFLGIDEVKKTDEELKRDLDSYYDKLERLSDNKEIQSGILHYFIAYMQFPTSNLLKKDDLVLIYPFIQRYSQKYPGVWADGLNQEYNAKIALAPGKVPPSIDLLDLEGKKFSFESHKGKVVYVDFWASWCGPCRKQTKEGSPILHEKFGNKDVVFVYVSIDKEQKDWRKAIAEDQIKGIHLIDLNGDVEKVYDISYVPRYMLIGKDGKIISNNAPRPTDPQTVEMISKALSE